MVVAIIITALWVVLFLSVAIVPFLPKVDSSYAPAPREFARRAPQSLPTAPHEQAA